MRKLNLDILNEGQIGLTSKVAGFYLEGLVYCLMSHGHSSGTFLEISGEFEETIELIWSDDLTEQMKQSWNDSLEASEYGATGIAILLIKFILDLEVLQRNIQGEKTDYKIGNPINMNITAFLEVSGIFSETPTNTINVRVRKKIEQVEKRLKNLPAYIIVTEFSKPKSKIIKND